MKHNIAEKIPEDLIKTTVNRIGNFIPTSSLHDAKNDFFQVLNEVFKNEKLKKVRYIEGIVIDKVKFSFWGNNIRFRIRSRDGLELPVYVPNKSYMKSFISPGQLIGVKGRIDFYKDAFWKGFNYFQIYAEEVKKVGYLTTDYQPFLEFIKINKRKKKISFFNKKKFNIALITSQSSEAIEDIHKPLSKYKIFDIQNIYTSLYDAQSISKAIDDADSKEYNLLIVARGGTEKIEVFNDYNILNSMYRCKTPIISAIGHASNTPLSNVVADISQDTPSAAAKLIEYKYKDHKRKLLNGVIVLIAVVITLIYFLK